MRSVIWGHYKPVAKRKPPVIRFRLVPIPYARFLTPDGDLVDEVEAERLSLAGRKS